MKRVENRALLLTTANFVGGFFNYLFLLWAAQRLDTQTLGHFSFCLNSYALFGIASTAVLYWGFFSPISKRAFRRFQFAAAVIALATVGAFCSGWLQEQSLPLIFGLSFLSSLVQQFLIGRFQRAEHFGWFGILGAFWAASKVGVAWSAHTEAQLAVAYPLANSAAVLLVLIFYRAGFDQELKPKTGNRTSLLAPLSLAVAHAWFPARDLLTAKLCLGNVAAGEMHRLQLYSRILYYGPLALLHIGLPIIRKIIEHQQGHEDWARLRRIEIQGAIIGLLATCALGLVGPWTAKTFLGLQNISGLALFLSCLAIIPAYGTLRGIQIYSALGAAQKSIPWILTSIGLSGLALLIPWSSLTQYLTYSALTSVVVGAIVVWHSHRVLSRQI